MLFKSNQFSDLKSKKALVKLVRSINLCQFFNFLLHITVKSCHVLRFNYLEMSYFLVYLLTSGFPIVGGGANPPPQSYNFFLKTSPIKFWGAPPIFGTPVGNPAYVKLRYITAPKVSFLEFHIPRLCDRHIFSLFLTKHLALAQFLLFCNGTFTILMLNFSI